MTRFLGFLVLLTPAGPSQAVEPQRFEYEEPLTTLVSEDIALTATQPQDDAGARAQVVRRQADGSWLRVLDRPDFTQ